MSDLLKKPYEISLWDDILIFEVDFFNSEDSLMRTERFERKLPDFNEINPERYRTAIKQFYKEVKICTIGSDIMEAPIRAFNPSLELNTNGSSNLTFSIFYRYYDADQNTFFDNPFVKYLVNERKIKVRYGALGDPDCKWYDFVIKSIQEDSESKMFTYSAKNIFINELSKSGFNLEFNPKLENNQGTLDVLADRVLEGSDWKYKTNSSLDLKEIKNEPLYSMTLARNITATYMEDVEENGQKIHSAGESIIIKGGEEIYGFYTPVNNESPYFQFLYVPNKKYEWDEKWTITNSPNFYVDGVTYTEGQPSFIVINTMAVSNTFRGNRLVRKSITKYDPKMDRYVSVYNDASSGSNEEIYGFIENNYISASAVNNYITNPNDFESYAGWHEGGTSSGGRVDYPSMGLKTLPDIFDGNYDSSKTNFTSYLTMNFANGAQCIYNTGISDFRTAINGFAKDEKYVCRIKYGEPNSSKDGIVPSSAGLTARVQKYSLNREGAFVAEATYFTFSLSTDGNTGYVIGTSNCATALSFSEMLKGKYCLALYSNTTNRQLYIEDVQFFPYASKGEDGKSERENMVLPGEPVDARVTKTYYYYNPKQDYTSEEDVKYLYKGEKPNPAYVPAYNDSDKLKFTKVRSITASESNRFNLIQNLCEIFKCWADFEIVHNLQTGEIEMAEEYNQVDIERFDIFQRYYTKSGDSYALVPYGSSFSKDEKYYIKNYRQKKWVSFHNFVDNQNHVGFRYGTNLKSIQRTLESDGIVSKIVVKNNSNQHAKDGFCSIARADENPTGENFVYDFSYYVGQKLLNFTEVNNDLHLETTGYLGYYKKLRRLNSQRDLLIEELSHLVKDEATYSSNYQTYAISVEKSKELKEDKEIEVRTTTGYSSDQIIAARPGSGKVYDWSLDPNVRGLCTSIKKLEGTITRHIALRDKAKKNLDDTIARKEYIDGKDGQLKKLLRAKTSLEVQFYKKYSRFIQEGSWISEDYIDDNLYYLDAESTLHTSSQPKVNYAINVLEISQIEGYENYKFGLGDRTFIEDTEFFGWHWAEDGNYVPAREEVIVSQIILSLDSPEMNTVKVQNYRTQFEDLFQRIAATTQAVEFSTGEQNRVQNIVQPNGTINIDTIQNSILNNSLVLENSRDQSVTWDDTGITTTSLTSPNEIVRIVSGGIFLSIDGGVTWHTGISGKGINASYITTGQLDTSLIRIMNGNFASFRWDPYGLSAYEFEMSKDGSTAINFNYSKFIRFDQYGLYGINGYANFNPTIPDENGDAGETIVGEEKILKHSDFAVTWSGFQIKSNHQGEGDKGYISITSKNDFQVVNNEGIEQIKIGYLSYDGNEHIYGIRINDAEGTPVMESDSQGKLWIKNKLYIGDTTSTVGIGYLEGMKPEADNVHEVFNANDKFIVYEDGAMKATDGNFTGTIYATGGKIGNLTIEQIEGGIEGQRGVEIQSKTGFIFKIDNKGNATPKSLTLEAIVKGFEPGPNATWKWTGSSNFQAWEPLSSETSTLTFSYEEYQTKFSGGTYFVKVEIFDKETYTDYCTINVLSDGNSAITVTVESSSGDIFINGNIGTTLTARVYQNGQDITSQYAKEAFSWTKYNRAGDIDQAWTNTHQKYGNVVSIDHLSVNRKAKFVCDVII